MKKAIFALLLLYLSGTANCYWTQPVLDPPRPVENEAFAFEMSTACNHIFLSEFGPPIVTTNGTVLNVRFSGLAPGICFYEPRSYRVDLPALTAGSYRLVVEAVWNQGRPEERMEQLADQQFVVGSGAVPIHTLSLMGLMALFFGLALTGVVRFRR